MKRDIRRAGAAGLVAGIFCLVFSGYAGAVGDMIGCSNSSFEKYQTHKRIYQNDPNDNVKAYIVGIKALCLDKVQEGMAYMQKASDMGHVNATNTIAMYYYSDGTFDKSDGFTEDQKNYDATIYYYERTAKLIESDPNYPKGVNRDQDSLENQHRTSAYVFTQLPFVYYMGYVRAILEIINSSEKLLYEDSIEVLKNMRHSADRCLRRPALSEWGSKRDRTYRAMQIQCKARKEFAAEAIPLEEKRMRVARNCSGPLGDCREHKEIVNQLVELSNVMGDKVGSASL